MFLEDSLNSDSIQVGDRNSKVSVSLLLGSQFLEVLVKVQFG